jgi:molybdopterin molybdotransferase
MRPPSVTVSERLRDDCFALPPGVDWTPVDEALGLLREAMRCVTSTEEVALAEADGRVLAKPVMARRLNPPAANSAIDGYAFAWASLAGVTEGDLVLAEGRSAAGHPFGGAVAPGVAVRILTGAELPAGVDTVVLQEDSQVGDGRVRFQAPRKQGANARKAGEDAEAGAEVLPAGRRLTPADLARAAAVGADRLAVRHRLRLAVLSTGDELMQPGADPAGPGVFDANRPMLAALATSQGFLVVDLGAVADRPELVRAALDRGAAEADAIITTGGASAGEEDHVSRILRDEGRITTWRIAVKPGRPLALGFWNGVPVFGLPGNPVAAFVCFLIFARPALSVMAGSGWREAQGFMLPAGFAKSKKPGRREYLRARMRADGHVEVFHSEGSGLIGGLSWADGLVELPDGALTIQPGDPVRYLPFSSFGLMP